MNFSTFIENNLDALVAEWEAFARTLLPAAQTMSDLALRDHCRAILQAIVLDMRSHQSEAERDAKSKGAEPTPGGARTIAAAHGALRHLAGFDLAQVVSEFRAMRASVLAMWRRSQPTSALVPAIEEIARFNEAIDQALAESVERYSSDVTTFLAVIGHDLRSPLWTIQGSTALLGKAGLTDALRGDAMRRIDRSSLVMGHLISDLLEYARTRMGRGMAIERKPCDLRRACEDALDTMRAVHPRQDFAVDLTGELNLQADPIRLQQVLVNLLNNAVQHGDPRRAVSLTVIDQGGELLIEVRNFGNPIPPEALQVVFEPMVQLAHGTPEPHRQPYSSLGLGLFIVREIVRGHDGTIEVSSSAADGTVFTVRLPKGGAAAPAGSGS